MENEKRLSLENLIITGDLTHIIHDLIIVLCEKDVLTLEEFKQISSKLENCFNSEYLEERMKENFGVLANRN